MNIVVNTRILSNDHPEGYAPFIVETFQRITRDHPEHQFVFIADRSFNEKSITGANVKMINQGVQSKHPLLWKLWYDVKLPALLKKYKADILISTGGLCSLSAKLPQAVLLYDLSFIYDPSLKGSAARFYKKNMGKSLQKAGSVITLSSFSKTGICEAYNIEKGKVDVVYGAAKEIFQPLSYSEKQAVKDQYTEGKEYFLYTGSIQPHRNLLNLLKAFSVFKKRQQSGMRLLLAGEISKNYRSFINDLKTYRYRDDVQLIAVLPENEIAKLTGASYALIYPSSPEGFAMPVLEAMRSEVPVIIATGALSEEITKGGAMYAAANDFNAIADAMMRIYKDETLCKELIQKGKAAIKDLSWEKTAESLWQALLKAIG